MSFMEPEITDRGLHWRVETADGTWFVPGHVVPVPEWIKPGVPITESWPDTLDFLGDHIEPQWDLVTEIEVVTGYCGRLSAPGYLDGTNWSFDRTKRGIKEQLKDLYGD
jgi:hypothetical protein